ncbi:MAG: S26 family signal peptidase [Nocardioides sp.]
MRRVAQITGGALLAALVCLVGFAGLWRLHGGRVERVETPSMGTVAPVGSLLWVAPVDATTLRPGDFISFHPPGDDSRTYSHRVLRTYPDGSLQTQGAITAPDPWRLQPSDVVGEVVMTWPGIGLLVHSAPLLVAGGCAVALTAGRLRREWRALALLVGASVVLAAAITVYRPFTNAEQLAFTPVHDGARATYVSTGLLPVRLTADGGGSVVLADGERGSVTVPGATGQQRFAVHLGPAVPWEFWAVLVGPCFVPAAGATAARATQARRSPGAAG